MQLYIWNPRTVYRALLDSGKICHNPSLGCFTVIGTAGSGHVVKLHPKESCTCPSSSTCYHVLAVKLSIGIDVPTKKVKVNLSQLHRNTRSRKEKKSGRKVPRPGIHNGYHIDYHLIIRWLRYCASSRFSSVNRSYRYMYTWCHCLQICPPIDNTVHIHHACTCILLLHHYLGNNSDDDIANSTTFFDHSLAANTLG